MIEFVVNVILLDLIWFSRFFGIEICYVWISVKVFVKKCVFCLKLMFDGFV